MALLRIDGQLKEFSNDTKLLTLTDEEYEIYPNAKNYDICITETRLITNTLGDLKKPDTLLASGHVGNNSVSYNTNRDSVYVLRSGQTESLRTRMAKAFNKRDSIEGLHWYDKSQRYVLHNSMFSYSHVRMNEFVDHLYKSGEAVPGIGSYTYPEPIFVGSIYRNHVGGLVRSTKKIISCSEFQNHYLVKYENDPDTYLLLRCYACNYEVRFAQSLPGSLTKRAGDPSD